MVNQGYALARAELIRALTAYSGITTADGNIGGTTLVDANLIGKNDFITGKSILVMSGDSQYEDKAALSFNNTNGTIILVAGFSAQVKAGTSYRILNISSVELDVALIKTQTAKLAGVAPGVGAVSKNWQAAEQDLVSIGADNVKNKLHLLVVGIQNLAGNIAIRLYMQVNGVERRIYPIPAGTTFSAAADAPAIPVVDGTMGIHEVLRVTVQSDNAADNGQSVDYDYLLEAM